MANNPALYNAVIAGITAGNQKRWKLMDSNTANFEIFNSLVKLIAEQIDALIDTISEGPNSVLLSHAALLHSICEGYFQDQHIETVRHHLPAVVQGIATIYQNISDNLLQVEIMPEAGLTPGSYSGQPIAWNGTDLAWKPLPVDEPLRFSQITAPDASTAFIDLNGDLRSIALCVNGLVTPPNYISLANFDPAFGTVNYARVDLTPTYVSMRVIISENDVGPLLPAEHAEYKITPTAHEMWIKDELIMQITEDGVGFFGAAPVRNLPIVGSTDALVLDAMIGVLVAYGLAVDNR